jgi:hypothetical protein
MIEMQRPINSEKKTMKEVRQRIEAYKSKTNPTIKDLYELLLDTNRRLDALEKK